MAVMTGKLFPFYQANGYRDVPVLVRTILDPSIKMELSSVVLLLKSMCSKLRCVLEAAWWYSNNLFTDKQISKKLVPEVSQSAQWAVRRFNYPGLWCPDLTIFRFDSRSMQTITGQTLQTTLLCMTPRRRNWIRMWEGIRSKLPLILALRTLTVTSLMGVAFQCMGSR